MIQPLGPLRIWQKVNSFFKQDYVAFENQSHSVSGLSEKLPGFINGIPGITGVISKGTFKDILPLSPFGPHAEITGLQNQTSFLENSIESSEKYRDLIFSASQKAGIDAKLFNALVSVESNYNPNLISRAGAVGLAQLMPDTAYSLGVLDSFDPEQNLNGGARYLSQMIKKFSGNIEHALAAYNAGPTSVKRYNGIPPYKETQNYIKKVLQKYHQ